MTKRHKIRYYPGFAGVPGYEYCEVCEKKWPQESGVCGGEKAGAEQRSREAAWWSRFEEHLANGDSIPEKGRF
jgi:hypothetical protein